MKQVRVERKVKFKVSFDESCEGARRNAMEELREIMASRSYPIPFKVSGSHARFGSYEIERIW